MTNQESNGNMDTEQQAEWSYWIKINVIQQKKKTISFCGLLKKCVNKKATTTKIKNKLFLLLKIYISPVIHIGRKSGQSNFKNY